MMEKTPDELNEFENYAIRSIVQGKYQWLPEWDSE